MRSIRRRETYPQGSLLIRRQFVLFNGFALARRIRMERGLIDILRGMTEEQLAGNVLLQSISGCTRLIRLSVGGHKAAIVCETMSSIV